MSTASHGRQPTSARNVKLLINSLFWAVLYHSRLPLLRPPRNKNAFSGKWKSTESALRSAMTVRNGINLVSVRPVTQGTLFRWENVGFEWWSMMSINKSFMQWKNGLIFSRLCPRMAREGSLNPGLFSWVMYNIFIRKAISMSSKEETINLHLNLYVDPYSVLIQSRKSRVGLELRWRI